MGDIDPAQNRQLSTSDGVILKKKLVFWLLNKNDLSFILQFLIGNVVLILFFTFLSKNVEQLLLGQDELCSKLCGIQQATSVSTIEYCT